MNDFGRLLEREIPRLRRYARALTHDASRADDLVQDTVECLTYMSGYPGSRPAQAARCIKTPLRRCRPAFPDDAMILSAITALVQIFSLIVLGGTGLRLTGR